MEDITDEFSTHFPVLRYRVDDLINNSFMTGKVNSNKRIPAVDFEYSCMVDLAVWSGEDADIWILWVKYPGCGSKWIHAAWREGLQECW